MSAIEWTTQQRRVRDLVQLEYNPRKITDQMKEKLIRSLEKFNLAEIPAINTDNTIISGNQRVMALIVTGRGGELIDVRVPDRKLTELEIKEYAIIANTHAGEFDIDVLTEHFSDLDFAEIGFDIPNFNWALPDIVSEGEDDGFEIPDQIETDIVEGDYFTIGPHRLYCGDSTDEESWRILAGEDHFDLILTDPPYNVDYVGKTKDALKLKNDRMSGDMYYQFLFDFNTACSLYTKAGASWYMFHADTEGHNVRQAFIDSGNKLSEILIWSKNTMVMGRQDYHWQHEPILYGWKEGAAHSWYNDRRQTTVLHFDRPQRSTEHPTMKPIPLLAYLINNSSKSEDIIGDGFTGSGSTMVAAHQTKRRCFGMDIDPKYCQVVLNRMVRLDPNIKITKNGNQIDNDQIQKVKS